MRIEYIDKAEQLPEICDRIAQAEWVAIDTEFLREKTYYPIFCLLQIATRDWVVCVDPITIKDLSPLFTALNRKDLLKVLHSCRQDLEIFFQLTGEVPAPVFDTQIAAPLLGFQENPGYAMLVSNYLNINLPKTHTRTDWSQRPLNSAQLKYAADDVIYLGQVYELMYQQLNQLGRLAWLEKDFAMLENPLLYQPDPKDAWLKIRGKNRFTGKQLLIIQRLCEWREKTAQAENRPKNWLLKDDLLLELCKFQPETIAELAKIHQINERLVRKHGQKIVDLITGAKQSSDSLALEKKRAQKKTPIHEAILDVLSAVLRIRAEENSINPVAIASRKDLEKLLFDEPDIPLLQGWRYSMVGQELQGLLKGESSLSLKPDDVVITHHSQ